MVDDVEELCPELQIGALRKLCIFLQNEIHVSEARTLQGVATRVSWSVVRQNRPTGPRNVRRLEESCRVEPLGSAALARIEVGIAIGAGPREAIARAGAAWIVELRCERPHDGAGRGRPGV